MTRYPEWIHQHKDRFKADILAFGPHPDDVELNIGGILALHAQRSKVVVVDLTEGEMSSNGTLVDRRAETVKASECLQLTARRNLFLPDGGIVAEDVEQQSRVVAAIRYYQPDIVLMPYWEDRHPDHVAASRLIEICLFKSGLKLYDVSTELSPYRPTQWYYYFQHHHGNPDLIVDITEVFQQKIEAISAYQSQFVGQDVFPTHINQPGFLQKILARDQYFGGMIGTPYGEGLVFKKPLTVKNLLSFSQA